MTLQSMVESYLQQENLQAKNHKSCRRFSTYKVLLRLHNILYHGNIHREFLISLGYVNTSRQETQNPKYSLPVFHQQFLRRIRDFLGYIRLLWNWNPSGSYQQNHLVRWIYRTLCESTFDRLLSSDWFFLKQSFSIRMFTNRINR